MAKNSVLFKTALYRSKHSKLVNLYTTKIIDYGKYQEHHQYKKVRASFKPQEHVRKRNNDKPKSYYSLSRAKSKIIQIIEANHKEHGNFRSAFFTSTFRRQYKSRKTVDRLYRNFVRRYSRYLGYELRYIAIPELHKSGAIHFHSIFFNTPYIDKHKLEDHIWKYGRTNIQSPDDVKNISAYCAKYVTKAIHTQTKKGQKTYLSSRGLHLPKVSYTLNELQPAHKKLLTIDLNHKRIIKYEKLHIHQAREGDKHKNRHS